MSRDPIHYRGGDNLSAYVMGNPVKYVDPQGLLELEVDFALKYPKAAKRIMSLGERMTWMKYTSMKEYGQTTKERIDSALTPGSGPTVCSESMRWSATDRVYGKFRKEDSEKLFLNSEMLREYESGSWSDLLIDATTEHELVHYFNYKAPTEQSGEEGLLYETSVYGGPVSK